MDTEGLNRPMNSVQFGSHCDKHHIFLQDGGKMNMEEKKEGIPTSMTLQLTGETQYKF